MSTPKIKDVEPDITPEEEKAILDIGGDPGDYEAARALYTYADSIRKERDVEWKNVAREAIPLIEGRLEIAKKEKDSYLVKWATETIDALNTLIEEAK